MPTGQLLKIGGVLGVAICAISIRVLQIYPFETNGDSILYWISAEHLLSGLSSELPTWNFRLARLGILIPAAATKLLTGNSFWGYHITPIAASALCAVLIYRIGARLSTPEIGFFGAFLFLIFPPLVRNSVQLLPGIFEATYLLASVFALVLYLEHPKRFLLVVSSGCLFLAYLTKFSALLCLPGFLIVLWKERADLKNFLAFIGTFAGLYILEHGYMQLLGYDWGRFEMLLERAAAKSSSGSGTAVNSLSDFLSRWDGGNIGRFWVDMRTAIVPAIFLTLVWGDSRLRAVLIILFSHILLTTFSLRSLDPPTLMTNLQSRYLTIYAPLVIILIVQSYFLLSSRFLKSRANGESKISWLTLPFRTLIFASFFIMFLFTDFYYLGAYGSIGVLVIFAICLSPRALGRVDSVQIQKPAKVSITGRAIFLILVTMVSYPLLKPWLPVFLTEMKSAIYQLNDQSHPITLIQRYQNQFVNFYRSNKLIVIEEDPNSRNSARIKSLGISAIYLGALGTPLKWSAISSTTEVAGKSNGLGYAAIALSQTHPYQFDDEADVLFVPKAPWTFVEPRIQILSDLIRD